LESAQGEEKGRRTGGRDVACKGQDESPANDFLKKCRTKDILSAEAKGPTPKPAIL
jgi:hypothetical protein